GDEEPQDIVAPYYRVTGDHPHHGGTFPASEYSLVVDIESSETLESVNLSARVSGHVGSLRYAWGYWRLQHGPAAGFEMLGTSSTARLPPGAYNVVLDVADTVTGAFARTQTLIYFVPQTLYS